MENDLKAFGTKNLEQKRYNLTDFLENPSIKNKQAMLSALQQKLYDADWKVRFTAFIALGFEDHLPAGFKLSFVDKLLKLFFWRTFVYPA